MEELGKGPLWLSDIPNPNALLIVAHADDETIFSGGLILVSGKTRWTIVCCTDEGDQIRQHEFLTACQFLTRHSGNQIEPVLLNLPLQHDGSLDHITLAKELESYSGGYDIVFTHNSQGEYGQEHHKQVHRSVIEFISNPNTWVFISPGSKNVNQEELKSKMPKGNIALDLSPDILKLKVQVFQQCHVSQARLYGYDEVTGKLRNSDLKATLSWYFEYPGREDYTFYR